MSLPKDPSEITAAIPGDRTRIEGGGNLHRAAMACGVRRYIQQASGFFLAPGSGLADESAGLVVKARPRVALSARAYAELEARVLNAGEMEGPGVWLLLRARHLVPPGGGKRRSGSQAGAPHHDGLLGVLRLQRTSTPPRISMNWWMMV